MSGSRRPPPSPSTRRLGFELSPGANDRSGACGRRRDDRDPMRRGLVAWHRTLARLTAIGADPRDDERTKQNKTLLVLISVLIIPIAVVWGSVYLIFGSWVGYVPFVYALVLLGAIVAFA